MKRLLTVLFLTLFVVVMFAGSAIAGDLPPGQCNKIDPPGQEKHCDRTGAPAADVHCDDIKSPTQRARCEAEANP